MDQKERILKELEPMFADANKAGLWFKSRGKGYWFSPDDLKNEQEKDHFLWGKRYWELRDPEEYLKELEEQKAAIKKRIQKVEAFLYKYK